MMSKFGVGATLLAVAVGAMLLPGRLMAQSTAKSSKPPAKTTAKSSSTAKPAASKASTKKKSTRRRTARARRQTAPTNDRIREIQSALIRSGHLNGEPTGKWDAQSVAAMKNFQTANNLKPTGKVDAATLQKLGLGSETAGLAAPRPPVAATETGSRQR